MSLKLPSTVTDEMYLKMPSDVKVVDSDEEWGKCGQWILTFLKTDLSWADKAWTDLQALLSNGCLLLLKTSTAASSPTFNEVGSIFCFTRPGQEEALKAAKAIREVVHYENLMFYKSNKATQVKRDRIFGFGFCSEYMHTFLGHFYVRDAIQRWIFVDALNESKLCGRNHAAPEAGNFRLDYHRLIPPRPFFSHTKNGEKKFQPLPSSGIVLDLNHYSKTDVAEKHQKLSKGYFKILCTLQRGEDNLVEADCVWLAVKSLYDDGDFIRIESFMETKTKATIYCFVTDCSDLQILVNICKRILKKTRLSSVIYFCIGTDLIYRNTKYIFTPQGEVYEEISNAIRKFIFNFGKI